MAPVNVGNTSIEVTTALDNVQAMGATGRGVTSPVEEGYRDEARFDGAMTASAKLTFEPWDDEEQSPPPPQRETQRKVVFVVTTAVAPYVNQAKEHLRVLQFKLDDLLKTGGIHSAVLSSPFKTKASSPRATTAASKSSRRMLQFSAASYPSSESSSNLSVTGVGAKTDEGSNYEFETPELKTDDIFTEILDLFHTLESDKTDTQQRLQRERERVQMLKVKIDELADKRMRELPLAVQREHEACSEDISELQWHVSYRSRQKKRYQQRLQVADTLNEKLQVDIDFVQNQCPLIEEKLDLETGAMSRIHVAQNDTDGQLNATLLKQHETQQKSNEAFQKAEKERKYIKRELDGIREQLRKSIEESEAARTTYENFVKECDQANKQVTLNEEELQVLRSKCENAKTLEQMQTDKVQNLKEKIKEAEYEHHKLTAENEISENEMKSKHEQLSHEIKQLEHMLTTKERSVKEMKQKNRENKVNIADMEDKIQDCEIQVESDGKNIERIYKEMGKCESQMAVTEEEYHTLEMVNKSTRKKLAELEQRVQMKEETLMGTADTLEKQLKEEAHKRAMLQARIASDTADMNKLINEGRKKQYRIEQKHHDVQDAVSKVLSQVEKMRQRHEERLKTISDLREGIVQVSSAHQETETKMLTRKNALSPEELSLRTESVGLSKRLDHIEWRTEMIEKKTNDMGQQMMMMERSVNRTEIEIDTLTVELEELTIQLDRGQGQVNNLETTLTSVKGRVELNNIMHEHHMTERTKYLIDLQNEFEIRRELNRQLSAEYERLRDVRYRNNNTLLDLIQEKISLESCLKDHNQLHSLQQRMHWALAEYFKQRGLFNQAGLAEFKANSAANDDRIAFLQTEMDVALSNISLFLKSQLDGSAAKAATEASLASLRQREAKHEQEMALQQELTSSEEAPLSTQPELLPFLTQELKYPLSINRITAASTTTERPHILPPISVDPAR